MMNSWLMSSLFTISSQICLQRAYLGFYPGIPVFFPYFDFLSCFGKSLYLEILFLSCFGKSVLYIYQLLDYIVIRVFAAVYRVFFSICKKRCSNNAVQLRQRSCWYLLNHVSSTFLFVSTKNIGNECQHEYIWRYLKNLKLQFATSKIKNVEVIEKWMQSNFQRSWKYLR